MTTQNTNISLCVAQILLAAVFGSAGVLKITMAIPDLAAMMTWPGNVPPWLVRFIGTAELLGAIGIVLPALTRNWTMLTPLAALGFATIQVLVMPVHVRQGDITLVGPLNLFLLALSIFVIWGLTRRVPSAARGGFN